MYAYVAGQRTKVSETANMNSDIILAINIKGVLVYVNKAAERIFRQSRPDLIGRKFLSLVRHDFQKEIYTYMNKQINEKLPNNYYEYPAAENGGSTIWLGQNMQLLIHNGQVEGLVAAARDITYRRAAHKEHLNGATATAINRLHCTAEIK